MANSFPIWPPFCTLCMIFLRKDRPWKWTEACGCAFVKSKQQLQDLTLLVHYDLKKSLSLACDASPYRAGAVISHVMEDGTEKPIPFAPWSLTSIAGNYSQTEKEALSIVFGVKKSHSYIYGRKFTLIRYHQSLVSKIWSQDRCSPVVSSTNARN